MLARNYCLLSALLLVAFGSTAFAEEFSFRHEHVLGTSLELAVETDDLASARAAEAAALAEIDRLNAILSAYDPQSELMRWSATRDVAVPVSHDLFECLRESDRWHALTNGAFDARAAAFAELWRKAEAENRPPSDADRRKIAVACDDPSWKLSGASRQAVRLGDLPIDPSALAKGYIVDRVCEALAERPGLRGYLVNIGGDLRSSGTLKRTIAVADPFASAENAEPLLRMNVEGDVAIATSGNYRRFHMVEGRKRSHIFDPRTGLPVDDVASVTVVARNATDADAAATAVTVLGPDEGLAFVESQAGMACLIVTANGTSVASKGWKRDVPKSRAFEVAADAESAPERLTVNFALTKATSARYRRPYVAIWLEDEDGYPVKTALLWMQTESPGPRWHRDLTRWYRNDRIRKAAEDTELIGTISGATHGPGEYQAEFDGTDNAGKPLPPGEYTLCIEAVREHGTYQLIREKVELGKGPIAKKDLKGNAEIPEASYEYRARENAAAPQ